MHCLERQIPPPEVFISYTRADEPACTVIAQALTEAGATVWIDKESIQPGDSWIAAIFRGLESADYVMALISRESIKSRWVEKEIETTIDNILSGKTDQHIIPVLLEPVEIPPVLRTIQYVDLTTNKEAGIRTLIERICEGPVEQKLSTFSRQTAGLQSKTVTVGGLLDTLQQLEVSSISF